MANESCGGGIIVGTDDQTVYIATAAHILGGTQALPGEFTIRFEGDKSRPRSGTILRLEPTQEGDLAVIKVARDADLNEFLTGLDFAILSPEQLPANDSPVTSVGCYGGTFWVEGASETLLASDRGYLRFNSNVTEGQAGGALYNEDWELIGMTMGTEVSGIVYARPIESILRELRAWNVPVSLVARQLKDRVRSADELLRERSHTTLPHWLRVPSGTDLLIVIVVATYLLWFLVLHFVLLRMAPLAILHWNEKLGGLDWKLPKWLGEAVVPLRNVLLIGLYRKNPLLLDAWVLKHVDEARRAFKENLTYASRNIYVPLPVVLNSKRIAELKPEHIAVHCSRARWCMVIRGEGGLGKTTLACQLALWSMADDPQERLISDRRVIPVIIEPGLDFNVLKDVSVFLREILGRLQRLVGAVSIPEELLKDLLATRRVLVIIDGYSEMPPLADDSSRARLENPDFPVAALIITSRNEETFREEISLLPTRIDKERLIGFISAYTAQFGIPDLQDVTLLAARQRLVEMLRDETHEATPLLAKLYAEQLVAISNLGQQLDKLPTTVPDLMLSYVSGLNRNRQYADPDNPTVHRTAQIASWKCLKEAFRPGKASKEEIRHNLEQEGIDVSLLDYLEHRLGLVRTINPAETDIYFSIDPLSEYLAAMWTLKLNQEREDMWLQFFADADSKVGAPGAIRGFLVALRDCCLAKAGPPLVLEALSKRIAPSIHSLDGVPSERLG